MAPPFSGRQSFCYFRTKAAAPWCHLIYFSLRPPSGPGDCNVPPVTPPLLARTLWVWAWKGSSPAGSYGIRTAARSLECRTVRLLCFRIALSYEIGAIIAPLGFDVKSQICNYAIEKLHIKDIKHTKTQNTAGKQFAVIKTLDKFFLRCYDPCRQGKGVMSNDTACHFSVLRRIRHEQVHEGRHHPDGKGRRR